MLEDFGVVIIERLLPPDAVAELGGQLDAALLSEQRRTGAEDLAPAYGRRLGAETIVAAPTVRALLTHPLVTGAAGELLGRHSKRLCLKLLELVYLPPGGRPQ